ncbi:hypothetical protein PUNSTDRAFT_121324 [Punctularia strigosozonata HHB-11173 SS5]|uniref:uncharacterized protein n=1 Tax=Punctularia strigosozonata (strain HHB-11173) TaxID=741275 RepID=UPI00044168B5|nr:uncharacterized protein PUNSTDRAFT_121324 [Punctularia strigosozonata HHB-11173 SS5]EIN07114.1 hypothetical protein PUNSTDRAFT_121324 [Punctularia strigosozonata HHB-11173 SS5]
MKMKCQQSIRKTATDPHTCHRIGTLTATGLYAGGLDLTVLPGERYVHLRPSGELRQLTGLRLYPMRNDCSAAVLVQHISRIIQHHLCFIRARSSEGIYSTPSSDEPTFIRYEASPQIRDQRRILVAYFGVTQKAYAVIGASA